MRAMFDNKICNYLQETLKLSEIDAMMAVIGIEELVYDENVHYNHGATRFEVSIDSLKHYLERRFLPPAYSVRPSAEQIYGLIHSANEGVEWKAEPYTDEAEIKRAKRAEAEADPARVLKTVKVTESVEKEYVIPTLEIGEYLKRWLKLPDNEIAEAVKTISGFIKQANKSDDTETLIVPWTLIKGYLIGKSGRSEYQAQLFVDGVNNLIRKRNRRVSDDADKIKFDYNLPGRPRLCT
jgi:hypothetical protein